jgi:hypothetical protein
LNGVFRDAAGETGLLLPVFMSFIGSALIPTVT